MEKIGEVDGEIEIYQDDSSQSLILKIIKKEAYKHFKTLIFKDSSGLASLFRTLTNHFQDKFLEELKKEDSE